MIIPLDKLFANRGNRYLFTKAAMLSVDKVAHISEYPGDTNWKVVPNILNLMLNDKVRFRTVTESEYVEEEYTEPDFFEEENQVDPEELKRLQNSPMFEKGDSSDLEGFSEVGEEEEDDSDDLDDDVSLPPIEDSEDDFAEEDDFEEDLEDEKE